MVNKLFNYIKYYLREGRFLKNINKLSFASKKALISYTVMPFLMQKNTHTNKQESQVIVDLLTCLGYQVDVIHFSNKQKLNYSNYDLIFGFGEPFENSFKDKKCSAKKIYYATGAHAFHQNAAEVNRIIEFNQKYNSNLLPQRIIPWFWTLSTSFSDFLIVIGNEWTANTYYKFTNKPIFTINATALINPDIKNIKREIKETRKNFLWFGSLGLVHKGLDLCLEYFTRHTEYKLHICGPIEEDFFSTMEAFLSKPNIIFHGFVDVNTHKFIEIVSECLFAILPSCSEGQSTAILTAMSSGLIPVATRYTGLDIDRLGYLIEQLNIDSMAFTIRTISSQKDDYLKLQSTQCANYIKNEHALDNYKDNLFKIFLKQI